jgi:site-specific DNA-cytosine methylase
LERELVLLSVFDGIGTAALSLTSLGVKLHHHIAWETDEDCRNLVSRLWPKAELRGDFRADKPADIATLINTWKSEGIETVIAAAPPCPSFSRILGEKSQGSNCEEGKKFGDFASWLSEIEKDTLNPIRILVENVVPTDRSHFNAMSTSLAANYVVADSIDYKLIHRPRLWWDENPLVN